MRLVAFLHRVITGKKKADFNSTLGGGPAWKLNYKLWAKQMFIITASELWAK
jgi:hypothetical protein